MIYYATKETMRCFQLKTPEKMVPSIALVAQAVRQKEAGQRIYEWGCKVFDFDGRTCLQVMHFATKMVIYLIDWNPDNIEYAADAVAEYLLDLYQNDEPMQAALKRFYQSAFQVVFDRITDRSMITCMNSVLNRWAMDGDRFYDYIDNGTLRTKKINRDVNDHPATITKNGQTEWIIPYEYFAQEIKKRFS